MGQKGTEINTVNRVNFFGGIFNLIWQLTFEFEASKMLFSKSVPDPPETTRSGYTQYS